MDLVANNLSYKPDDQYHLNEVSFNFKEGNLYTILGRTLSGKMVAKNIRRIFLHRPPSPEEIAEKRIEDRGNWKGQNFPGREEHQQKWRSGRHE